MQQLQETDHNQTNFEVPGTRVARLPAEPYTVEMVKRDWLSACEATKSGNYTAALKLLLPAQRKCEQLYLPARDQGESAGFFFTTHDLAKCLSSLGRFEEANVQFQKLLSEGDKSEEAKKWIPTWAEDCRDNLSALIKQQTTESRGSDKEYSSFGKFIYTEEGMLTQIRALGIERKPGESIRDTYVRARRETQEWYLQTYGVDLKLTSWESKYPPKEAKDEAKVRVSTATQSTTRRSSTRPPIRARSKGGGTTPPSRPSQRTSPPRKAQSKAPASGGIIGTISSWFGK